MRKLLSSLLLVGLLCGQAVAQIAQQPAPVVFYSGQASYIAAVSGQATTAAILLSIEPSALIGFRLLKVCVSSSAATAAAAVTVTVQRRTTAASSGGTQLTNEGTGATTVSKMNPADPNYSGIARLNGTPGTAGAVLDQFSFLAGLISAPGASPLIACKDYGVNGEKAPYVAAGVINGLSINVSAAGGGGLASGSISATIVQE